MVQALRAQDEVKTQSAGSRVLWLGGKPPTDRLGRIFQNRGYTLVREGGDGPPPPMRVASLDIGPAPKRGDKRTLAKRRIAVAHSDPGVADGMAQTVRAMGATAAVVSLSELGLSRVGALQPHVALFDPGDLEGNGFSMLLGVWADRLLRWTPVLLTPTACFDATGNMDFTRMVSSIEALSARADALVKRAQKEQAFELDLAEHGPVLTLRALVESGHALSAQFETPDVNIGVDVAEGIVVGAQRHGDRSHILGPRALAVLTGQLTGRVRVERRDRPAVTNIMAPLDTALGAASTERASLIPSARPLSGPTPMAATAPDPAPEAVPEVFDSEEEEEVTQVATPQELAASARSRPTPAQAKGTLLGMPAMAPPSPSEVRAKMQRAERPTAPLRPSAVASASTGAASEPTSASRDGLPAPSFAAPASGSRATVPPATNGLGAQAANDVAPPKASPQTLPAWEPPAANRRADAPGTDAPVSGTTAAAGPNTSSAREQEPYDWDTSPTEAPPGAALGEVNGPTLGDKLKAFGDRAEVFVKKLDLDARARWLMARAHELLSRGRNSRAAAAAAAGVLVFLGILIGVMAGSGDEDAEGAEASAAVASSDTPQAPAATALAARAVPPAAKAATTSPDDAPSQKQADVEDALTEAEDEALDEADLDEAELDEAELDAEGEALDEAELAEEEGDDEDRARRPSRRSLISDLLHRGNRNMRAKRYRAARANYIKALKLAPGHPRAMEGLTRAYLADHKAGPALKMARALVRRRPGMARHHRLLGDAYAQSGNIAGAQKAWKRAAAKGDRLAKKRLGL